MTIVEFLELSANEGRVTESSCDAPLRRWRARQAVSQYMSGELATAERSAVERHLEICATCPPMYASLVGARAGMADLREPDRVIGPKFAEKISAQFRPL